jgi:hypothetical protein
MEMFTDTVNEMLLGAIQQDIAEHLFEQWDQSNLDEGVEYAEFKFMEFAPDNLKKDYNTFYGLTSTSPYYFNV